MVGPLRGGDGDPGAPIINAKNVNGGPPWEAVTEIRERPQSMKKMSMAPPGRRCWRSGSAHHSMQKVSMEAPLGGVVGGLGATTIQHKKCR
jgi:hypothetical protein